MQLQGMQAIAFLLVATGNYLDTGDWPTFMIQVLVQLPSIGACSQCPRQGLAPFCHANQPDDLACHAPACCCRPVMHADSFRRVHAALKVSLCCICSGHPAGAGPADGGAGAPRLFAEAAGACRTAGRCLAGGATPHGLHLRAPAPAKLMSAASHHPVCERDVSYPRPPLRRGTSA